MKIDDMRVISNRSTGALGQRLAVRLADRGAVVTLLEGPVRQPLHDARIRVKSFAFFDDLAERLSQTLKKKFDAVVHAAAVSDYKIARPRKGKLSSGVKGLKLSLTPLPKLINRIKRLAPTTFLIGFKLERAFSGNRLFVKTRKLFTDARCDLVVANSLTGGYHAAVLSPDQRVLAKATARDELVEKLVKILEVSI